MPCCDMTPDIESNGGGEKAQTPLCSTCTMYELFINYAQ